jgi:hypothetical protein
MGGYLQLLIFFLQKSLRKYNFYTNRNPKNEMKSACKKTDSDCSKLFFFKIKIKSEEGAYFRTEIQNKGIINEVIVLITLLERSKCHS